MFHWLSLCSRCHCGGRGPEARNQPSARMYMKLRHSLWGFGRGWNWCGGRRRERGSHTPSVSAFSSLALGTFPSRGGRRRSGWVGRLPTEPPELPGGSGMC